MSVHALSSPTSPTSFSDSSSSSALSLSTAILAHLSTCHRSAQIELARLTQLVSDHSSPSTSPSPSSSITLSSLSHWTSHSAPMRIALSRWHDEINVASDLASDLRGMEQSSLRSAIDNSKKLLHLQQDAFRSLALQVQRHINRLSLNQRISLLGGTDTDLRHREQRKKLMDRELSDPTQIAQNTAAETTATLQRMTQLMATELEKSAVNISSLDSQTRLLRQVNQEYNSLTAVIRGARSLLSELESRDRTDKLMIWFACLVFTSVVFYILKKRVFWFLIPNSEDDDMDFEL